MPDSLWDASRRDFSTCSEHSISAQPSNCDSVCAGGTSTELAASGTQLPETQRQQTRLREARRTLRPLDRFGPYVIPTT